MQQPTIIKVNRPSYTFSKTPKMTEFLNQTVCRTIHETRVPSIKKINEMKEGLTVTSVTPQRRETGLFSTA